jgi:hypothetical protein
VRIAPFLCIFQAKKSKIPCITVSVKLIPAPSKSTGFGCIFVLTTLLQLFTFVQLHGTHLTDLLGFILCAQHPKAV